MKKCLSIVMAVMLLLGESMVVSAAEVVPNDPYQTVLMSINEEYGLQLGYEPVNPEKTSLEEYEKMARSLAISQKELEEYIANREEYVGKGIPSMARSSTKTVTKDCWSPYDNYFTMTATYDVNGTAISNPRDIHVNDKSLVAHFSSYAQPSTDIIDSKRTLAVTFVGEYHMMGSHISGIKVYCEFYYDS